MQDLRFKIENEKTEGGKDMIMSPVGGNDNKLRSYVVVSTKGNKMLVRSDKRIVEAELRKALQKH